MALLPGLSGHLTRNSPGTQNWRVVSRVDAFPKIPVQQRGRAIGDALLRERKSACHDAQDLAMRAPSPRSSSNRFGSSVMLKFVTPVTSPLGRLRLVTRPIFNGSAPPVKTIGIVVVTALAASAGAGPPVEAITATFRLISSVASAGSRSN